MNKKMKYLFAGAIVVVFVWMIADTITRPGVTDLEGDFRELAYIRNEQNTGPVVRIYAVSVADTLWENMLTYGNYMPHNKYGNTKVYFFLQGTPAPTQLSIGKENMNNQYKKYCIGLYEKNAMSKVNFRRYPFQERDPSTWKDLRSHL